MLTKKKAYQEKIKVRGHRNVKCELNHALVMIHLKFNLHSSYILSETSYTVEPAMSSHPCDTDKVAF